MQTGGALKVKVNRSLHASMVQSKTKRAETERAEQVPGPNSTFAEVVSYLQKHDGVKRTQVEDHESKAQEAAEAPSSDATPQVTKRGVEESEKKRPLTGSNIQNKQETLQIKSSHMLKRTTIRGGSAINLVLELTQLPFEIIYLITGFSAAEESFRLVSLNRDLRAYVLRAKTFIYKKLVCLPLGREPIQQHFKIIEQTGSRDLFVFFEVLLWGIKQHNLDFVRDQIEHSFPLIVFESLSNRRVLDRFLAFFTVQVAEILQNLFEQFRKTSEGLDFEDFIRQRRDQVDAMFEYLLNKRRKYDGNTLPQLAVKLESPLLLDELLSQP